MATVALCPATSTGAHLGDSGFAQIGDLNDQAKNHVDAADPAISVDTKNKELVGSNHPGGRRRRSANTPQAREIFQKISGGAATLSAGLVVWVAIWRVRAMYCGARMVRRSATSDSRVVAEKRGW